MFKVDLIKEGALAAVDSLTDTEKATRQVRRCIATGVFDKKRMLRGREEEPDASLAFVIIGIIMILVFNFVLYCKWKDI